MGTSALKYTCPHVELACYSMSISVPVHSTTYKRLSYQACPSCAISIVGQALENLENTLPPKSTDKLGSECSGLAKLPQKIQTSATKTSEKPSALSTEDIVQPTKPVWRLLPWTERFFEAAQVAHNNDMVRAFAIAPTASCSYRSRDLDGFTCTPEIAPPIARMVGQRFRRVRSRKSQLWRR